MSGSRGEFRLVHETDVAKPAGSAEDIARRAPQPTSPPSLAGRIQKRYKGPGMTTIFTAPESCSTEIPTMLGGKCYSSSCTAFSSVDSEIVIVNFPDWTSNYVMTSTDCMPSGFEPWSGFYYGTGVGCPKDWNTATSNTNYVACCPSKFPEITWSKGDGIYYCYGTTTFTAGDQVTVMATGIIGNDPGWNKKSFMSMTTMQAPVTANMMHLAVRYYSADSSSSDSSSGSSSSGSGSGSSSSSSDDDDDNEGFIPGLSKGGSIGVIVGVIIVIILISAVWSLIKRRVSRPKLVQAAVVPPPPPMSGPPPTQVYYQPEYGAQSPPPGPGYGPGPAPAYSSPVQGYSATPPPQGYSYGSK